MGAAMVVENAQPPLSNKGGNTHRKLTIPLVPTVSINLDWLRYTSVYNPEMTEADNLRVAIPRFSEFALTGEELQNGRGFNRSQRLTIGVIHWHTARAEQGVSVELTGRDLGASRAAEISDNALLRHINTIQARVSTMDGAIDVYALEADPLAVYRAQKRGTLETTVKSVGVFESSQRHAGKWYPASTVYLGSPTSERQIKIYDKAAQLGIAGDWVRIEMRWRGPYARAAHRAMLKSGIEATTRAAVLSMANFGAKWWRVAMHGPLAQIEPVSRPETKTLEWLLGAVYRTMDRELGYERERDEHELMDAFGRLLVKHGWSK